MIKKFLKHIDYLKQLWEIINICSFKKINLSETSTFNIRNKNLPKHNHLINLRIDIETLKKVWLTHDKKFIWKLIWNKRNSKFKNLAQYLNLINIIDSIKYAEDKIMQFYQKMY